MKAIKKTGLDREFAAAIDRCDADEVQRLVAAGADINLVKSGRVSFVPLWLAVNHAGQELSKNFQELAGFVSDYLATKQRDHTAERARWLRIIKMLIDANADVNKEFSGSTSLRNAVHWEDVEVVKLLLANGANPNAETFTIMSKLAKREGRKVSPGYWNTVLHEAVEKKSAAIVEALLAAGADTTRTDHEGRTPKEIAQANGALGIVELVDQKL